MDEILTADFSPYGNISLWNYEDYGEEEEPYLDLLTSREFLEGYKIPSFI